MDWIRVQRSGKAFLAGASSDVGCEKIWQFSC